MRASGTEIITSPNDNREYQYVQLENQLKVLLISDSTTDKAAASLVVGVGSGDDPSDRQGLAHFLEHMLFLGTKKHPEPDAYQDFISRHGGSHNAYTALDHTNYFFDINADYLHSALDRFAQFFIAPLMTPKYVDRERRAVHAEFKSKLKDDNRRVNDAFREIVMPEHPLSKFGVGNLQTLADREGDLVRDDLIDFYQRYYSASNMALVVIGKNPLTKLEAWVKASFSSVKHWDVTARKTTKLFSDNQLPARLTVEAEKNIRQLTLTFPVPNLRQYELEKPLDYISHIIGHEGKGSLLSLLKEKEWAEALSAGYSDMGSDDYFFQVDISLTEAGIQQRSKIESLVFKTLALIRKQGIAPWRFEELAQLAEIDFRFQERAGASSTVTALASALKKYGNPKTLLRRAYQYEKFDADVIRHYLDHLTPKNVLISLNAQSVTTNKVSKYYKTPYAYQKIAAPGNLANQASTASLKAIHLPEKNQLIPENLNLVAKEANKVSSATPDNNSTAKTRSKENNLTAFSDKPELLSNDGGFRTFYMHDTQFNVPKGTISVRIKSPQAAHTKTAMALNHLYTQLVSDALNEFSYPALLTGLNFSVSPHTRGLNIVVSGYSDKQDLLLDRIIQTLKGGKFSEKRFNSLKKELLRSWKNQEKSPPYRQLMDAIPEAVFQPFWSKRELTTQLKKSTFDDFKQFSQNYFFNAQSEALIYGNYSRQSATYFSEKIKSAFHQPKKNYPLLPEARVTKLSTKHKATFSHLAVDHPDRALALYIQGSGDDIKDTAYMLLMLHVLKSPYFHELRTEKQLGYIVFATSMPFLKVPGALLVVQSPDTSGDVLIREIKQFLTQFNHKLPKQLSQYQRAVKSELLEKPKNQFQQATLYWQDLTNGYDNFDHRQQLAKEIDKITAASLGDYYQKLFISPGKHWWWLASEKKTTPKNLTTIDDFLTFKLEHASYRYP